MKDATLTVKISQEEKKLFQEFCAQSGMNPSVAISMFIANVTDNWKLPFEVSPSKNRRMQNAIREVEEMERHPDDYRGYSDTHEMIEDILNEV